jgi:hypothetical protein
MHLFRKFSECGKARLPGSSKSLADASFLLYGAHLLAEFAAIEGTTRLAVVAETLDTHKDCAIG